MIILAALAYFGFSIAINGVAGPWIMDDFGLSQAGLARLFAWISASAVGAWMVARAADRLGRRRVLLWCLAAVPASALGSSLSFSLAPYALWEVVRASASAAGSATAIVWLAETSEAHRRAAGQARAGIALAAGNAAALLLMPLADRVGVSWRSLLGVGAAGVVLWPIAWLTIRETESWRAEAATTRRARDLFGAAAYGAAVPVLAANFVSAVAVTSATPWRYFRAVEDLGVRPAAASALLLAVGAASLLAFRAGARAADRFGRVPTLAVCSLVVPVSLAWSFWGPPPPLGPIAGLAIGFLAFGAAVNAATVSLNTLVTEVLPPSLRTTMIGSIVLTGALAQMVGQTATAVGASYIGGVSPVIGWLGWLGVPVAAIYLLFVREPARSGATVMASSASR